MANHKQIHVLIDRELEVEIERFRAENGLSLNGAIRYLCRQALAIPRDHRDAVWREVRAELSGRFRETLERAFGEISPIAPPKSRKSP